MAAALEKAGAGSFATRIAHYQCELAQEADDRADAAAADQALARALEVAPHAARPLLMRAQRLSRQGDAQAALEAWAELRLRNPESFARVAHEFAAWAQAQGQTSAAVQALAALYQRMPGIDLLRALAVLEGTSAGASPRLLDLLRTQPSLSAALELLDTPRATWPETARQSVRDAVSRAARPLQRYRCAACGFEAQRHFWQCPGCLGWDTFPPQRVEEQ
jgi:lipopolysaccharide biosynthesis regulator YciM